MKIGIVTVQDSNNFGSFLQAYALQYVLQQNGHEVFFIRSRSRDYVKSLFYSKRPTKHELLHFHRFLVKNFKGRLKYQRFQREQKCFKVLDHYNEKKLDLVILGSDEIWNVQNPVFRQNIFYGVDMNPVMAYAVSIGNASIDEMSCIPTEIIRRISPIYARDLNTAKYLKKLSIENRIVCDPTMLVDKKIFQREYNHPLLEGSPFILIYSYGISDNVANIIRQFANKKSLRVLSTCFSFSWCDGVIDCSALDFCAVLQKATYVFTSTFHGTIFSVLNHKQFVSMPQSKKTSDILNALNLNNVVFNEKDCSTDYLQELFLQDINYKIIDSYIENMKKVGLNALFEGIDKYDK